MLSCGQGVETVAKGECVSFSVRAEAPLPHCRQTRILIYLFLCLISPEKILCLIYTASGIISESFAVPSGIINNNNKKKTFSLVCLQGRAWQPFTCMNARKQNTIQILVDMQKTLDLATWIVENILV